MSTSTPGASDPPMPSIPAMVRAAGRRHGDTVALIDDDRALSYAELAEHCVVATRACLAAGIGPGDRVGLWAPNSIEWITAAVGAQGAGAAIVPADSRMRAGEVSALMRRAEARTLVCAGTFLDRDFAEELAASDPDLAGAVIVLSPTTHRSATSWESFLDAGRAVPPSDAIRQIATVAPHDVADIIYTSGTTGSPKGVIGTHRQNLWSYARFNEMFGLTAQDRQILMAPFSHCFGYKAGWMLNLQVGATGVLVRSYTLDHLLALIEQMAATVIPAPPTVLHEMLAARTTGGHDLSSLRLAMTGSTTIPIQLVHRLQAELVDHVVVGYGLTEASGIITSTRTTDEAEVVAATVGAPLAGIEVTIVDPDGQPCPVDATGEIVVRGPNVMPGYVDDPEATGEVLSNGQLRTGDLGSLDADGYLTIRGRMKDMYICGGYNVYPAEVENVLLEFDGVAAVAVVGVPEQRMGEVGVAFVVAHDPASFDVGALASWAGQRLASYKVPRRYEIVEAFPRNSLGKVLKRELWE